VQDDKYTTHADIVGALNNMPQAFGEGWQKMLRIRLGEENDFENKDFLSQNSSVVQEYFLRRNDLYCLSSVLSIQKAQSQLVECSSSKNYGHPREQDVQLYSMLKNVIAQTVLYQNQVREVHAMRITTTYHSRSSENRQGFLISRTAVKTWTEMFGFYNTTSPLADGWHLDKKPAAPDDTRADLVQLLQEGDYTIDHPATGQCGQPVRTIPTHRLSDYGLSSVPGEKTVQIVVSSNLLAPLNLTQLEQNHMSLARMFRLIHADIVFKIAINYAHKKHIPYNQTALQMFVAQKLAPGMHVNDIFL
jgi:hypothetical protein